ncbi:MAG: zinc-dependent peptidase [Chitinophagaceae bacterium]|jgi:MtfA peptidase|uniref:zinc-dependent peptidase n=1 Tax=unclassified Paraflavitalea TaxID=2798305 RepID=UPI003D32D909|nr:zinc-dependent peptidase [Chitinophagaceae bacterium]
MELVILLLVIVGIIVFFEPLNGLYNRIIEKLAYKKFLAHEPFLHSIISKNIRFYKRLTVEEQHRFLFRTYIFRQSKRFHYIELEEIPEMSVLISAVAVQLTFGLERYKLNYFKNIFVLKDDYHYGLYSRPFQGHVDHSGIYLSWDNFMRGVQGLTANCNVGLHEMGHALTYVNFITQTEEDKHFKKEFKNFSKVARPIFESMQTGRRNILGDYAGTNYHEFWAVCVELFFENPIRFRHELPDLFAAMKKLLNQDPIVILNTNRIKASDFFEDYKMQKMSVN